MSEILNLHRGQGHDIMVRILFTNANTNLLLYIDLLFLDKPTHKYGSFFFNLEWRDDVQCPAEEEYCNMVIDKTGGLFRLAVGLMQAFSTENKDTNFSPLVNNLGLYFQIRDDLINLVDEDYFKAKTFCEDLTEGKFSFPIVHCVRLNKDESGARLLHILRQRTEDVDVKLYAQSLMKHSGSLRYTWEKCISLKNEIVEQIESLGGNPPLLKLVEYLHATVEGLEEGVDEKLSEPLKPPSSL